VLTTVDALVTPTKILVAPRIGEADGIDLSHCAAPFNQAHLPVLSVPCGFGTDGLPVGLQLAGRPLDEAGLLRIGYAYQQATDWHRRHPPQ
jgi:aspartyl-tRNA(Asn)/glutamyl-tRNA(Gln) amidotransferase subunit A